MNLENRYHVVSHIETDRPYRIVGSANKKAPESHFILYLRILPGIPFYIVPHRDRRGEFVVFSGKTKNGPSRAQKFFCRVGSAIELFDKNVIEIHLPDLKQVYFLKLEGSNPQNHKNAAAA